MPTTTTSRPPPTTTRPGLLLRLVELVLKVLGLLLGSLLFSILLEWLGMLWFWPDQAWHHSQAMWLSELGWLSEHFTRSLLVAEPTQATAKLLTLLHEWAWHRSGWASLQVHLEAAAREDSVQGLLAQLYISSRDYLLAALFTVLTFLVRLMVLTLSMPMFLLAVITGGVDGLMRRDLRRFGADRESSFVYHRARRLIAPLLISPWVIYLSLPWSIAPAWVLLPCAVLLGSMVTITAASFKKYL